MSSSSLQVPRRSQPAKRARTWRFIAAAGVVILAVGWLIWFLRTPDDLPTSNRTAEGNGVVGQDVYVGMFAVGSRFDRTLVISEVKVDVKADGDVDVEPKICRGGTISVTTDATRFCSELEDPEGAEFSDGDSIVLVVSASAPDEVSIGRIEIFFREGIRWGNKEAGLKGATLTFADHTPGTVDENDDGDNTTERPSTTATRTRRAERSRRRGALPPDRCGQSPTRSSNAAARSAASVISSASIAFVRWNQLSASRSRPTCSSVSAYA